MSRNWVVWASGQNPGGVIWALNRRTRRRYLVATQSFFPDHTPCSGLTCTPPALSVSLDGNTVVWNHFKLGAQPDWIASAIRYRVLPNGPVKTAYTANSHCEMQTQPQLLGGRVVWIRAKWSVDLNFSPLRQCGGDLQTDVMTLRLGQPRARQITSDHMASQPGTNGNWLTWQTWQASGRCACYSLQMFNMRTKKYIQLSNDVTDSIMTSHLAVWLASSNQSTRIVALDLKTKRKHQVAQAGPLASTNLFRALAWTHSHQVAWERDAVYNPYDAHAFATITRVK